MSARFDRLAADLAAAIDAVLPPDLDPRARRTTLATNSTLVPRRAELLVDLAGAATDLGPLRGRRVLDAGAGFGAVALYLAAVHGAEVVAVEKSRSRLEVCARLAAEHGLAVTALPGRMERVHELVTEPVDLAILNNSFVYVVEPEARERVLRRVRAVLRPGGWIVKRDASLLQPVDPFSGLPLVHLLGPRAAGSCARRLGRQRSLVRMTTPGQARRELERAGFAEARVRRPLPVGRHHHVVGRRGV